MIGKIKSEITVDSLGRGYGAMSDRAVADDLNTSYRNVVLTSVTAAQIFEAIVPSEFVSLTAAQQVRVDRILSLGDGIDATAGSQARAEILDMFVGGTTTRTNLATLVDSSQTQTRAAELGLPFTRAGHVELARS